MLDDPFKSGQLLLPDTPPEAVAAVGEGLSLAASILVAVSVLLFLLALRSFLNVLPYLSDNILRARGSHGLGRGVRQQELPRFEWIVQHQLPRLAL